MKKIFLFVLFLWQVYSFAQVEIPILKNWANDFSNTLDGSELNYLNTDLRQFADSTSNQVVLLMIPTLNDYPIEMFAYETATKNKIGTKENNNGILFIIAKNDKKVRIEVGYGLEGALPDALCGSILRNEVRPYFKQGEYFEGIKAGINAIKAATVGEYKAPPKEKDKSKFKGFSSFIIIIIFIIISIISRIGRGKRGGPGGFIFLPGTGSFGGRSSSSWGGFSGSSGGFGGFSGGGGSFGGGGASGSW
jgi:uncharacterized protein